MKTYTVEARLLSAKREPDHDYHLVLSGATQGATIIAEIPDPACMSTSDSTVISAIRKARDYFDHTFLPLGDNLSPLPIRIPGGPRVTVTGVLFFDLVHGQSGVAPSGIELHPVLKLALSVPFPSAIDLLSPSEGGARKGPIPFTIGLLDGQGKPFPAPAGLVINLIVTRLSDLRLAKIAWVAQEAKLRHMDPFGAAPPPEVISNERDIANWKLPQDLAQILVDEIRNGPPKSIMIDPAKETDFRVFLFPRGQNEITLQLTVSTLQGNIILAAQAAWLAPVVRTLAISAAPFQFEGQPAFAAEPAVLKRIQITAARAPGYDISRGSWKYVINASLNGLPPADCFLDLSVEPVKLVPPEEGGPPIEKPVLLGFFDRDTGVSELAHYRLLIQRTTATADLTTVNNVPPTANPRRAKVTLQSHCGDYILGNSAVTIDIPPRAEKLVASPPVETLWTLPVTLKFSIIGEDGIEVTPEIEGIKGNDRWQIVFESNPSEVTVTPSVLSLSEGASMASVSVRSQSPQKVRVVGELKTLTFRDPPIRGEATVNFVFPLWSFIASLVAAPLSQAFPSMRLVPDRPSLCVITGFAWSIGGFLSLYFLTPAIELRLGPITFGFPAGLSLHTVLAGLLFGGGVLLALRLLFELIQAVHQRYFT